MGSDTYAHTVAVTTPPATIYAALQQPETWKGIGPIDDVWGATTDDDTLTGFQWSARAAGKEWEGTARRSDFEPDRSVTLALDSPEVTGTIRVDLASDGDGTDLTVTLDAKSKGMLAAMFWGVISDALRKGLVDQVESFGEQFN